MIQRGAANTGPAAARTHLDRCRDGGGEEGLTRAVSEVMMDLFLWVTAHKGR